MLLGTLNRNLLASLYEHECGLLKKVSGSLDYRALGRVRRTCRTFAGLAGHHGNRGVLYGRGPREIVYFQQHATTSYKTECVAECYCVDNEMCKHKGSYMLARPPGWAPEEWEVHRLLSCLHRWNPSQATEKVYPHGFHSTAYSQRPLSRLYRITRLSDRAFDELMSRLKAIVCEPFAWRRGRRGFPKVQTQPPLHNCVIHAITKKDLLSVPP